MTTPISTLFTSMSGEVTRLYLKDNPWQVMPTDEKIKLYRHCIQCGTNRFTEDDWDYPNGTLHPTNCDSEPCKYKYRIHIRFLPLSLRFTPQEGASPVNINELTSSSDATTESSGLFELDGGHNAELEEIEVLPLEERVPAIDALYIQYRKDNGLPVEGEMTANGSVWAQQLLSYRERCTSALWAISRAKL